MTAGHKSRPTPPSSSYTTSRHHETGFVDSNGAGGQGRGGATGPDLGAAAYAYASESLYVFPLAPRSKVPAIKGGRGVLDATIDLNQIAAWWRENPSLNIGCRPPPGVVVIDVDPRHGGVDSMCRLVAEHGPLCATTWTVRTGGGGWHLWVRLPDDFDVSRLREKLADGIDLKHGAKGYVVMPPSVTEHHYQWIDGEDLPWK